ncbi:hypothetical protein F4677DRAFT_444440 [Hypoxylon crocopeplum]|nr:hypothetical protein F4677DRAFT_444440 [Hypoxylon crocopeplum]
MSSAQQLGQPSGEEPAIQSTEAAPSTPPQDQAHHPAGNGPMDLEQEVPATPGANQAAASAAQPAPSDSSWDYTPLSSLPSLRTESIDEEAAPVRRAPPIVSAHNPGQPDDGHRPFGPQELPDQEVSKPMSVASWLRNSVHTDAHGHDIDGSNVSSAPLTSPLSSPLSNPPPTSHDTDSNWNWLERVAGGGEMSDSDEPPSPPRGSPTASDHDSGYDDGHSTAPDNPGAQPMGGHGNDNGNSYLSTGANNPDANNPDANPDANNPDAQPMGGYGSGYGNSYLSTAPGNPGVQPTGGDGNGHGGGYLSTGANGPGAQPIGNSGNAFSTAPSGSGAHPAGGYGNGQAANQEERKLKRKRDAGDEGGHIFLKLLL